MLRLHHDISGLQILLNDSFVKFLIQSHNRDFYLVETDCLFPEVYICLTM